MLLRAFKRNAQLRLECLYTIFICTAEAKKIRASRSQPKIYTNSNESLIAPSQHVLFRVGKYIYD